jgi:4-hydroxy 2-oxovalerate aldolase
MTKIEILDCTIRDGGYVNEWRFTEEQIRECYKACSLSGVDYMEIGFRNLKTKKNLDSFGDTYFCNEHNPLKLIPKISI